MKKLELLIADTGFRDMGPIGSLEASDICPFVLCINHDDERAKIGGVLRCSSVMVFLLGTGIVVFAAT